MRGTIPSNLCLMESGLKPLESLVKKRQKKFFEKMITERSEMSDDPLMHAINIVKEHNKPVKTYIESVLNGENFVDSEINAMKEAITNAPPSATRSQTYLSLNPGLEVHPMYTDCSTTIPDYLRITFTRFRISSHMLRVETGRWSRTPREDRLCQCGLDIQNESHVFVCPLVRNFAETFSKPCPTPKDFFEDTTPEDLKVLHQILDFLSNSNDSSSD